MRQFLLLIVLLPIVMLTACGQKGPLFLPPPEPERPPVEKPANDPADNNNTTTENTHAQTPPDSR